MYVNKSLHVCSHYEFEYIHNDYESSIYNLPKKHDTLNEKYIYTHIIISKLNINTKLINFQSIGPLSTVYYLFNTF